MKRFIDNGTVLIISKGRAGKVTTTQELERVGRDYRIIVEPQEYDKYNQYHCGKLITLDENDRGVAYARNKALQVARGEGVRF